ncbi:MAG TPA: 30S ribosome-binding factor RbfA [Candidatus Xenobia bacterium]|jgi:ribosome-binding factor A
MSGYRLQRVQNVLMEATSDIIRRLKDPRIGFVSVTEVEVSADLRHARIFVSVLGTEDERKAALDGLQAAAGFVRHELSQSVRLRHIPDVHFRLDQSLEHGAHIIDLINKANESSNAGSPQASAE